MSGWSSAFAAPIDFALTQGWNLVTVPVNTETEITGFLSTRLLDAAGGNAPSLLVRIWSYGKASEGSAPGWLSYATASKETSALQNFKPNHGYWFYLSAPAILRLPDDKDFSMRPLEIDRTSWAMVGFGNKVPLSFKDEVLNSNYIDDNHVPENIRRVWGYSSSEGWKNYQPANQTASTTSTMNPGRGYWFYVANHTAGETTYTVSESSPITITPPGASGKAALVIGGGTELFPPSETQVAKAFRGKRIAPARYSTSVSTEEEPSSETFYCDENTVGKSVGYAEAYSLSGEKLNNDMDSPIYCPTTGQVSYAVRFSDAEKKRLIANPSLMKDMVIKVKLASGAVQKAFVPSTISENISETETNFSTALSTDTTSTLMTALISLEMANKLGDSPDRFKLGERNAGLGEGGAVGIRELVSDSDPQIDISSIFGMGVIALNEPYSPLRAMKDNIARANDPDNIAVTSDGTFLNKADEIADLFTGNRVPDYAKVDKTEAEVRAEMDKARSVTSAASDLLSSRKRAALAGDVLSDGEMAKLEGLAENIMKRGNEAEVQLADVMTSTVEVVRSTRNDAALGGITKANLSRVLEKFDSSAAAKRTTEVMEMVANAMDVPEEMVRTMAQNPEAARHFAGIVGTASVVLDKAKEEAPAELGNLSRISSRLENSTQLIDVLVSNAPDSATASEIVVGAVGSSASRTDSAQRIMDRVSAVKTALETSGRNVVIDMQDVAKKSVGRSGDLKAVARALAVGSGNASDAAKVLAAVASSVTVEDMKAVVSTDKLKNEFSLDTRIVADAGRNRRIRHNNGSSSFRLDAGNTFDPMGESLKYRWFALDKTANTTTEINSVVSTYATSNISAVITLSDLNGFELRRYRLEVTGAQEGIRTAQAEVEISFFPELPPVVVAPQFVSAKKDAEFELDASHSFDSESGKQGADLHYTWTLTNLEYTAIGGTTPSSAVFKLSSDKPGLYTGVLEVKTSSDAAVSSTQEIRIRIEDELPPIADAGYGFVLTSEEAFKGVELDNFSYSMASGKSVFDEGHGMTFEWGPRVYFPSVSNGYTSTNPTFKVTGSGTYEITLKVTDSGKTATDNLTIIVKRGLPPVADAGFNSVLRLPSSGNATLTLDGSRSFSFAGDETYKWSGPVGLSSANETQKSPVISIGSGLFTKRTPLRYTLTVTDANGESTASKDVVVIPASQPPVIVLDQYPSRREFKPGEQVMLDASFSFSPNSFGSVQRFEWGLLSDFDSQTNFDSDAEKISLIMPQVTEKTELMARLTVTDNGGLSSSQDISFFVLPAARPPVAVINPEFIILEDKPEGQEASKNKVLLSATRSFSNHGNPMSYRWDFSRRNFSLVSGDMTSSVIELQAATGVADGIEDITLYVMDTGNNLSAQTVAKAKLVKAVAVEPVMVDARFSQIFNRTLGKMVPVYDSTQEIYVFEKGDKVRAFGFAYDPAGAELAVTAELFHSNKDKAKLDSIEAITPTTIGSDGFVEFSLESAALTVADTYCLLALTIEDQETLMHMRVRPDKKDVTVRPKAVAFVEKISSSKGAVAYTQATTRIIDTYPDDFIEIFMDGTQSTPAVTGSKLNYEWTYDWEVSDPTLKDSYPNIFINGANMERASFMLPLSETARVLLVKLTVTDNYTGVKSVVTNYRITASRKTAIPPVADAGIYQPIWVPLKSDGEQGDDPVVKLNGSASFSPVGNALSFKWESLSNLTVTTVSGTNSRVATVAVPEGIHYFKLTVTDTVTDTVIDKDTNDSTIIENKLVSFATARIEVKKEQKKVALGVTYGIEAWADIYPIDAIVGDEVSIQSQAWAFGLAGPTDITTELIKTEVILENESVKVDSYGQLNYTTSFDAPGRYKVQVRSWYDLLNGAGEVDVFNDYVDEDAPGDRSELFSREFVINVRPDIKPVHFAMNFPAVYSLESGVKTTAELNVNFDIIEEYQNDGLAWNFVYRYWIQSKDGRVSYDGAVIPSRIVTADLFDEFTADLLIGRSPLGVGEYNLDVELEAIARDAENKELGRFYSHEFRNFRVESSELDLQLMVYDKTFNHETQTGVLDFGSLKLEIQGFSADSTEPMILQTIYAADSIVSSGIMTASVPGFDQILSEKKTAGTTVTMIRLYMETNGGVDNGGVEREKFYLDIPEKGVWNLDLVYDTKIVEVDGQYVKAGEFFSFSKGEVIKNRLDENDVFRADIDLIFNEDVYTPEGSNYATRTQFFSAVTGRNVVEVPPVDNDGNWVDNPRDFFDRALQQSGNVAFSHTLFSNSLSGRVYPWEGALYLVEYKRLDGSSNYALMLITMVDDFGFAFRFAKAVSTTPDIKFAGASVQEMVRLNFDSERGEFVAVGGLPGTALKLMTSASKGYVVTSSQKAGRIVTSDVWNRITIEPGVFAKDGSISGNVYFVKEQNPREGDWIMIDGYAYRTLTGAETVVSLPTPLYFHYREPIAFSMIWTEKLSDKEFKVYFEGEPKMETLTSGGFTLVATDKISPQMFSPESGVPVTIQEGDLHSEAGFFLVTHDSVDPDVYPYLAFEAKADLVKAKDGKPVSRVRHVVTTAVIWGTENLVEPVSSKTVLQEIFADDYGYTSQAYLVKQTDLGEGIQAYEYNQWNPEDAWREFYAMKSGTSLSFAGEGSYDPNMAAYNYYFQPQDYYGDFNSLTNQSALTPVILLGADWSVGSSYRTTFRVGSSYQYGNIEDENDYRAVRTAEVRVLRFLPEILQRGVTYKNVVEVELRSKEGFPEYNENGELEKINFSYGETVIRRYLIADKLGVIRLEHTSLHEYDGHRDVWRNRRVAVGYMTEPNPGEVVRFVGADGNAALFGGTDDWTGFEFVDFRLFLDFPPNMGGDYKVSVRQLNSATNVPVEVASSKILTLTTEAFPISQESDFNLPSSTTYPYIFVLLKAEDEQLSSFHEIGRQEKKIEGLRGYEEMFVKVPAADDYATMRLFRNDGFSFAAGHHMWVEESKRDIAYVQKPNANDFELVLNPYLPDEHMDSNDNFIPAKRRIFAVTSVTGVDLKEKMEKILNSTTEITVQTGVSSIIPQAGNIYVYVGPNAERMKTGVGGEIVVLMAVTSRDLDGIDFLYTVKDFPAGTTKVSFRNSPLLNSAGYVPFQHDFYARRRIDASYRLVSATDSTLVTYNIDPAVVGWELSSGTLVGTTPKFEVELGSEGYRIKSVSNGFAGFRVLPYVFDIWGMPTQLNQALASSPLDTGLFYSDHKVFLTTDGSGNHFIMQIKPEFYDNTVDGTAGTVGTPGAYYLEYIYLSDGGNLNDGGNLQKFLRNEFYDDQDILQYEVRSDGMLEFHELPYDFGLTGKPYQAFTTETAAMELVKDSFGNGFEVRPQNPDQLDLFRDARVKVDVEFMYEEATGRAVPQAYLMRDGKEIRVARPLTSVGGKYVATGVDLGDTGYHGHFYADVNIPEYEGIQNGDYVRITRLHYLLVGSTEWLSIDYGSTRQFEYNQSGVIDPGYQISSGLRLVGAEIKRELNSNAYLSMLFDAPLSQDSIMYAHLVKLSSNNSDGTTSYFNPLSLSIDGNDNRILRAWFSSADSAMVTEEFRNFNLKINYENTATGLSGVMDVDGRVFNDEKGIFLGNSRIFNVSGINYLPASPDNEYYIRIYDDSTWQTGETTTLFSVTDSEYVTMSYEQFDEGTHRVHLRTTADGNVSYCLSTGVEPGVCVPLWNPQSKMGQGSIVPVDGIDYFVRFASVIPETWLPGFNVPFPNGVEFIVEWNDFEISNVHRLTFVPNVGLGRLVRESFYEWERLESTGLELLGFKIMDGSSTVINQGGRGLSADYLNLTFEFAPGSIFKELNNDGYEIRFALEGDTPGQFTTRSFTMLGATESQTAFSAWPFNSTDARNRFELRFDGLPNTERHIRVSITGMENGVQKTLERHIKLAADMTQFFWFVDLAQLLGTWINDGDSYSLIKGFHDNDNPDIRAMFAPASNVLQMQGGIERRLRILSTTETAGCDFQSAILGTSSCNFPIYTDNNMTNWSDMVDVISGNTVLVYISGTQHGYATYSNSYDPVYALVNILAVNPEGNGFSFEYVMSSNSKQTQDPDFVNFAGAERNRRDFYFNHAPHFYGDFVVESGDQFKLSNNPGYYMTSGQDKSLVQITEGSQADLIFSTSLVAVGDVQFDSETGNDWQAYEAKLSVVVPGGYVSTLFDEYTIGSKLPYALHQSLLPQSSSTKELVMRINTRIVKSANGCTFENADYSHYDHKLYVGRENKLDFANNFYFNLYFSPDMHFDLPSSPTLEDCVAAAKTRFSISYRYFDHEDTVADLDNIMFPGDFTGTMRPHPLRDFANLSELPNDPTDDLVKQAKMGFESFSTAAVALVTADKFIDYNDQEQLRFLIRHPEAMTNNPYENWLFKGSFEASDIITSEQNPSYGFDANGYIMLNFYSNGSNIDQTVLGVLASHYAGEPLQIEINPYDIWHKYRRLEMTNLSTCFPFSGICGDPVDLSLSDKVLFKDEPQSGGDQDEILPYRSQLVPDFRINSIRKEPDVGQFVVEFNRIPDVLSSGRFAQITTMPGYGEDGKFFIFRDLDFAQLSRLRELTEAYASTVDDEMNGVTGIDWEGRRATFYLDFQLALNGWGGESIVVSDLGFNELPVCEDNCRKVTLTAASDLPAGNYTFFFLPMLSAVAEGADDYHGNKLFQNNIGLYVPEAGKELKIADFMAFYPGSRMLMREFDEISVDSEGFMVPTSVVMSGGSIMEIPVDRMDGLGDVLFDDDTTDGWMFGIPEMLRDFPSTTAVSFPQMLVKRSRMVDGNTVWEDEELMRFVIDDATGSMFDVDSIQRENDGSFYKESETFYEFGPDFPSTKLLMPFMVSSADYYNPNLTAFTDSDLHIGDAVHFVSVLRDCYMTDATTEECIFNRLEEVISYRGYLPELTVKFEMPDPQNQEQMIVTTRAFTDVVIVGRYGIEHEVVFDPTNGWVRATEPKEEQTEEELMFFAKGFGYIMGLEDELEIRNYPEGRGVVNYGHSQVVRAFSGFGEYLDQSWDAGLLPGGGTSPLPSLNSIRPPFSVEGIEVVDVDGTGTEELVLNLNRPLLNEDLAGFAPVDMSVFSPAFVSTDPPQKVEDLTGIFGPGQFFVFNGLNLAELFTLHSLDPADGATFVEDLGSFVSGVYSKVVQIYPLDGVSAYFLGDEPDRVVLGNLKNLLAIHSSGNMAAENLTLYFSPLLPASAEPGKIIIPELDYLKNGVIGFYDLLSAGEALYFIDFQPSGSMNEQFWNYLDTPYVEELVSTEVANRINLPEGSAIGGYYKRVMPYIDDASSVGILDFLTSGDRDMLEDYFGVGFDSGSCNSVNWNSMDCFSDFYLGEQPLVVLADANLFKRFIVLGYEAEDTADPSLDEVEVLLRHEVTGSWFSLGSFDREEMDGIYTGGWHLERHLTKTIDGDYRKVLMPLMVDAGSVRAGTLPTTETMKAVGDSWVIKNVLPPHYIDTQTGTEFFKEAVETFTVLGYLPSVYIGSAEFLDVIAVRQTTAHRGLKQIGSIVESDEHFIGDYRENIMFFARNAGPIFGMENEQYPEWNGELHEMHVVEGGGGFIMNGYGYDNTALWGNIW
jgi:hypothetical protein